MTSKAKNIFINSSLIFLSFIFGFLGIELFLRQIDTNQMKIMQKNSQDSGSYRLKPNYKYSKSFRDFDVTIQTNSAGMNWREVSLKKPDGIKRIAFIGDSFTFGCWADSIENTFVGIVDKNLSKNKYEVLNFGVGGYGFDDYELILKEKVSQYSPDIVVLTSFNGNDFRDTFFGINKYKIKNGTLVWKKRYDGLPENYHPNLKKSIKLSLQKLKLYGLLSTYLKKQKTELKSTEFKVNSDFYSFSYWSQTPFPKEAQQAVDLSLTHLKNIREFCSKNNIKLVIVSIPYSQQVYAKSYTGDSYRIDYPQTFVQNFADQYKIAYYSLLEPIRQKWYNNPQVDYYVPYDSHFNTKGHQLVGSLITKYLKSLGL